MTMPNTNTKNAGLEILYEVSQSLTSRLTADEVFAEI